EQDVLQERSARGRGATHRVRACTVLSAYGWRHIRAVSARERRGRRRRRLKGMAVDRLVDRRLARRHRRRAGALSRDLGRRHTVRAGTRPVARTRRIRTAASDVRSSVRKVRTPLVRWEEPGRSSSGKAGGGVRGDDGPIGRVRRAGVPKPMGLFGPGRVAQRSSGMGYLIKLAGIAGVGALAAGCGRLGGEDPAAETARNWSMLSNYCTDCHNAAEY